MSLELITPLPPGATSHTRLARHGSRLVVLREILSGTDCSYPPPSTGLVTLQEVGELQGKRHALFPWVPGVTLRDVVEAVRARGAPVPLGLVVRVVLDAARAVANISPPRAHGGLQDGALQISFEGIVSVLDWGAPRVTRFRSIGRVNFAGDVFSLGATIHAALTGFTGAYTDTASARAAPSDVHPDATPALDAVVMRALSAQPDARQAEVKAFVDELDAAAGSIAWSAEQVGALVRTEFEERIRQLTSLGGTMEAPALDDEQLLNSTQPGMPSPLAVNWEVSTSEGEITGENDEPKLPRIDAQAPEKPHDDSDEVTRGANAADLAPRLRDDGTVPGPGRGRRKSRPEQPDAADEAPSRHDSTQPRAAPEVPWVTPSAAADGSPSQPTFPRINAPAPQIIDDESESGDRTTTVDPRVIAAAMENVKRAPAPPKEPSQARAKPLPAKRPSRPAADVPIDDVKTNPRAMGAIPNAPMSAPRGTTQAERLRARGQERLETPPLGLPAIAEENTAVKERPRQRPEQTAQTSSQLSRNPPSEPDALEPVPPSSGRGLRVVIALLLVVVLGLAAAISIKMRRPPPPPPAPVEEEQEPEAEAVPLAVADDDAGLDASVVDEEELTDGGEEEEEDEVTDGGEVDVDGGPTDAGTGETSPKKVVKTSKKKKHRRTH